MLSRVEKHVGERRSHLSRRPKKMEMIASVEDGTGPLEDPIHRAS